MKFKVVNLGCKVNRVESDEYAAVLLGKGWHSAGEDDRLATEEQVGEDDRLATGGRRISAGDIDLVLINSCTVTGVAAKKTRKAIRRALSSFPTAQIVVTGCATAIDKQELRFLDERLLLWDKAEILAQLAGLPSDLLSAPPCYSPHTLPSDLPSVVSPGPSTSSSIVAGRLLLRLGPGFPTRVGVKIQDGCDNACSYCVVRKARGASWSKPFAQAVAEVQAYAQKGTGEVVLTGINLGSYLSGGRDLSDLLEALLEQTEGCRIRLSSIEPQDMDERLVACMLRSKGRICHHLHLPLQSGSSKILKEMARRYDAVYFEGLVRRLHRAMPTLALATDVIVGFPGESEEEFRQTYELAKRCKFAKMHVFPYSKRKGTPAAERLDQVDPSVKNDRVRRLLGLAERLRQEDYACRLGKVERVVVEEKGWAMTESAYHIPVSEELEVGSTLNLPIPASGDKG